MSIIIKTEEEIEKIKIAGKRLAVILDEVARAAVPGVTALTLDELAERRIIEGGDTPAFKNYKPQLHAKPYPKTLCVSVNHEVVHGIPKKETVLKEGDVVSLDLGLKHNGVFADHAVTIIVGGAGTAREEELLKVTKNALYAGIDMATPGNRVGDIGFAIEQFAKKHRLGIVRDLAGHGVGRYIHEDPFIPNYGRKGTGELIRPGMVIAIEPMFTLGADDVHVLQDGYTVVTADHKKAAHFEHTILITETGPEIVTEV